MFFLMHIKQGFLEIDYDGLSVENYASFMEFSCFALQHKILRMFLQ